MKCEVCKKHKATYECELCSKLVCSHCAKVAEYKCVYCATDPYLYRPIKNKLGR